MTIKISEYGEDFLKLALRIDKHNKGYIDFYIGPEYISQIVASESITAPIKLLNDAETLIKKLDKQGYDKVRERYLLKTLTAMKTTVELLLGYDIPFSELILKLHDIKIQPIKDSEIYKLKEDFEKAYGRSGTFSYYSGSKLIIDKYGEFPQFQEFEELLRNPILPSDLV